MKIENIKSNCNQFRFRVKKNDFLSFPLFLLFPSSRPFFFASPYFPVFSVFFLRPLGTNFLRSFSRISI